MVIGALLWLNIPSNASGMAAKSVCSAAFVAGRPADAATLMEQDVTPASPALKLISTQINESEYTVTSKFLGLFKRQASLVSKRGCVLDEPADPTAVPYTPAAPDPAEWPAGDAVSGDPSAGVDMDALEQVVEEAFVGSGDPLAANARGVAVVQDGKLLLVRDGKDIQPNNALHGWSMTKTVAAMLAYKKFEEAGLDVATPVVEAFPTDKEPEWVGAVA